MRAEGRRAVARSAGHRHRVGVRQLLVAGEADRARRSRIRFRRRSWRCRRPTASTSASTSTPTRLLGSAIGELLGQGVLEPTCCPARIHGFTDAYTMVNGSFGVKLPSAKVTTLVKVNNLFNKDIQQHVFGDIIKRSVVGELRLEYRVTLRRTVEAGDHVRPSAFARSHLHYCILNVTAMFIGTSTGQPVQERLVELPLTDGVQRGGVEIRMRGGHDSQLFERAIGTDAPFERHQPGNVRVLEMLRVCGFTSLSFIGALRLPPMFPPTAPPAACVPASHARIADAVSRAASSTRAGNREAAELRRWWSADDRNRLLERPDLQGHVPLHVLSGHRDRSAQDRKARELRFERIVAARQSDELEMPRPVGAHLVLRPALDVRQDQRDLGKNGIGRVDDRPGQRGECLGGRNRRRSRPRSRRWSARPADRVIGWRLIRAFNMARILPSRLDGRAISGAGSHMRRLLSNARARSSRCVAYSDASVPQVQHGVVTRTLAVLPQTPARDPDERVEPVDGSKNLRRHLNRPVSAADVRKLVADDHARAVLRPIARRSAAESPWAARAPR